jgi:hypothetical protein
MEGLSGQRSRRVLRVFGHLAATARPEARQTAAQRRDRKPARHGRVGSLADKGRRVLRWLSCAVRATLGRRIRWTLSVGLYRDRPSVEWGFEKTHSSIRLAIGTVLNALQEAFLKALTLSSLRSCALLASELAQRQTRDR